MTIFCDWSETIAASGMRIASCGSEPGMRIRPNWPGVISRSAVGKTARARVVPPRAVDLIVDEVELAFEGPIGLVGEMRFNRDVVPALREHLALGGAALIGE